MMVQILIIEKERSVRTNIKEYGSFIIVIKPPCQFFVFLTTQ